MATLISFCSCYFHLHDSKIYMFALSYLTSEWTHVVINLISSSDVKFFWNGTNIDNSISKFTRHHYSANSNIVLGSRYSNTIDHHFSHFDIDELLFFNEALNEDDVVKLANAD